MFNIAGSLISSFIGWWIKHIVIGIKKGFNTDKIEDYEKTLR